MAHLVALLNARQIAAEPLLLRPSLVSVKVMPFLGSHIIIVSIVMVEYLVMAVVLSRVVSS